MSRVRVNGGGMSDGNLTQYRELTGAEAAAFQEQITRSRNSATSTRQRPAGNLQRFATGGTLLIHNLVDTSTGYISVYDVREAGRKLMTVRAAAKRLNVDERQLRGWVNSGNLPGWRMPRDGCQERWYIYVDVVQELLTHAAS